MTWQRLSVGDLLVDYIEEHGPQTVRALQAVFSEYPPKRVKAAVDRLVRRGRAHNTGYTSHQEGAYALGPKPGWLPNPLPAASVWHYAASCAEVSYEIPKL